ncbi:uncharacterized protein LOC123673593 isoform X2 [Harmonia axyridis]|uniref:uncharacterized protein LOC123673593 isoform X2 n=1 Tax=Harmonia axyridis TaxID=115357 RepID=UPI001E27761E|nr:uncharacterized protein LOC123673593 isoform X2 [Harmonia axyridis]
MSDCRSCRSSTSRSLRCNICGKTFPYNPECIGKLGQHNCEEHWIHKIGHFVNKKSKCGTPMEIQWIANAKVNVKRLKRENFLDLYKTTSYIYTFRTISSNGMLAFMFRTDGIAK